MATQYSRVLVDSLVEDDDKTFNYAIDDVDKDGKEELIVSIVGGYMGSALDTVYDYDESTSTIFRQFKGNGKCIYYNNGVIKEIDYLSTMNTPLGIFQPYCIYECANSGEYIRVLSVDSYDNAEYNRKASEYVTGKEMSLDWVTY
jgi:hypothetical protein